MYNSDFSKNKIYIYKTYSDDGKKVLKERRLIFLFGYAQKYQHLIYQNFLETKLQSFNDYKCDIFGKKINLSNVKKGINDKRCRYILCEEEIITYTVTGKVYDIKKSIISYDKTWDINPKVSKIEKPKYSKFRTLYKERDSNGKSYYVNGAMVSLPAGHTFSATKYGRIVKTQDCLEILEIDSTL